MASILQVNEVTSHSQIKSPGEPLNNSVVAARNLGIYPNTLENGAKRHRASPPHRETLEIPLYDPAPGVREEGRLAMVRRLAPDGQEDWLLRQARRQQALGRIQMFIRMTEGLRPLASKGATIAIRVTIRGAHVVSGRHARTEWQDCACDDELQQSQALQEIPKLIRAPVLDKARPCRRPRVTLQPVCCRLLFDSAAQQHDASRRMA